jgi:uncharacterized protein YkwD
MSGLGIGKTGRRRGGLVAVVLGVALVVAACRPQATTVAASANCPAAPPTPVVQQLFDRVNADRAANGLGALSWNPQLDCLAQQHSDWMASTGSFTHRDLSMTIRQPDFGGYASLGENILVGPVSMTADQMEDAWMNSPGHRANILSPNFDSIGIALGQSRDGRVWAPQNFGRHR